MAEELNNVEGQETETQETVTMTKEELDALLQKEGDKRVSSALKKQEQKNAEKVREAERLANMTAEQRYEETLRQREAAIAAKEKELLLSENKNACAKILAEKGLSIEFVDFVVDEDADVMDKRIKSIDKAFKASVKAEVEKRLGNKAPVMPTQVPSSLTSKDIANMSLSQIAELSKSNPELFQNN